MKKTMICGLLVVAANATASNWVTVTQTPLESLEYESTTLKRQGTHAVFWLRESYAPPQQQPIGMSYDSSLTKADLNCSDDTLKILSMTWSFHDTVVASSEVSTPLQNIEPDSILQGVESKVCRPMVNDQPTD
jgi:hypothetical protein